jgi:hypothetical protein
MVQYLKQYIILFNKAKTDLKAAQILFEQYNEGISELDLEIITFHLQQSAEGLLESTTKSC